MIRCYECGQHTATTFRCCTCQVSFDVHRECLALAIMFSGPVTDPWRCREHRDETPALASLRRVAKAFDSPLRQALELSVAEIDRNVLDGLEGDDLAGYLAAGR